MENNEAVKVNDIIKALNDPNRIEIIDILKRGRDDDCLSPICDKAPNAICPNDIIRKLDGMTNSKLSYHLKLLKEADMLIENKDGKRIFYQWNPTPAKKLSEWLDSLTS